MIARFRRRPLDEDTVFEIGSTGKSFTGILLADMVQHNELSLSDPIEEYLPAEVAVPTYEGRSITLVDLATHTSGLPNLPDNLNPADELRPYADYTFDQMYEELGNVELLSPPGSSYQYSNFGMGVLGHILELRTGMSYEDLVISRITDVLDMPDTRATLTPGYGEPPCARLPRRGGLSTLGQPDASRSGRAAQHGA